MSNASVTPFTGRLSSTSVRATNSSVKYAKRTEDYVDKFYKELRKWRAATLWSSSVDEALTHTSFKTIVEMGDKVIPLILEEIESQPDLLVAALPIITAEDPVLEDDRGDFPTMASAWLQWFHQR